MSDISMERLGEWLSPSEVELSTLATSQEEFDYFCQNAPTVRAQFVADAAKHALGEKISPASSNTPEDLFASLPVEDVLTRYDHNRLLPLQRFIGSACSIDPKQWNRYWAQLAEKQAELEGFYPIRTKYDTFYYTIDSDRRIRTEPGAEPRFEAAVARSQTLVEHRYPVRFHMRGVRYIKTAALNMNTVRDWVLGRTDFDMESLRSRWRDGDRTYGTGLTWPWAKDQVTYWQDFLLIYDKVYKPAIREQETYADAVQVLAPDVFKADYVPHQVTQSGEFIDFDDVYRTSVQLGKTLSVDTRSFSLLIEAAMRGQDAGAIERVRRNHIGSLATSHSGVVFLSREAATSAFNEARKKGGAKQSLEVIEAVVSECRPQSFAEESNLSELDQRLIFGWNS